MRVLVVEDSRLIADAVVEGLQDEGMAVDVAYDGVQAAAKLHVTPYEVVVLDRDLPGVPGDALCRIITDSEDPAMVLMLTAAGSPSERVAGLALGADDYLPKPFHFPELVLRVRALARRKPAARGRILRAAGIELDAITRIARREGRQLDLSAKEIGVLEALLTASPAPVSAEKLLQQVWDENADPFSQAVKTTVSRLRHKLGDPPLIDTIPGIGYRIASSVAIRRSTACSSASRARPARLSASAIAVANSSVKEVSRASVSDSSGSSSTDPTPTAPQTRPTTMIGAPTAERTRITPVSGPEASA